MTEEQPSFTKRTIRPSYYYIQAQVECEGFDYTEKAARTICDAAVRKVFGVFGQAQKTVQMVHSDVESKQFVIRLHKRDLSAVWGSLTMMNYSQFADSFRVKVLRVTPFLNSLANPSSRTKVIKLKMTSIPIFIVPQTTFCFHILEFHNQAIRAAAILSAVKMKNLVLIVSARSRFGGFMVGLYKHNFSGNFA
ncbi:hypothetical protein PROFUN_00335 [Planoprotostelium fungivorum]|uniref:Ribonucleases P/MRP subunit Pop8-like domain-containing protein n=1 Tax=Planoprotostelium fungivorum TaxID=1890364 RepID=A0A2P6NY35_9EUKA|nr:hypothetical protein PROFUN_00335 [Planoprotostelium fungivorum]